MQQSRRDSGIPRQDRGLGGKDADLGRGASGTLPLPLTGAPEDYRWSSHFLHLDFQFLPYS